MPNTLLMILSSLIASLFGWCLLSLFKVTLPDLERISLSFVLGIALITLFMFFLNFFQIPFTLINALVVPSVLILFVGFKEKHQLLLSIRNIKIKTIISRIFFHLWTKFTLFEKILCFLLILLTLTATMRAVYWPISHWDAISGYDARAKYFVEDGLISEVINKVGDRFLPYPPFTSLTHTYYYLFGVQNPTLFYVFVYIALILMVYYSLREYVSRFLSLSFCLFLAVTPMILEHAAIPYSNLSYTLFSSMGTIYLIRFFSKGTLSLGFIGVLLLSVTAWVRPGAEWFFIPALLILTVYTFHRNQKKWLPLIFFLLFLLFWLPWILFLKSSINYNISGGIVGTDPTRIKMLISSVIIGPINWPDLFHITNDLASTINMSTKYVLYLFIIAFVFRLITKNWYPKPIVYVLIFISVYMSIIFIGGYTLRIMFVDWTDIFVNSANRFVMVILPLLVYFTALSFSQKPIK